MNLYCRFLLIGLLCFLNSVIWGQFGTTPQIINFPKTEYNASNQNWAIDQDSIGSIFIANNKGLLIYNGAWNLYELPGQQIVRSVACDGNRIYTGGFGEFGYWQKELLGNYIYHSLTDIINYKKFSKEEIWRISKFENKIYFQSFSTIYVLENGKISPIPCPGNIMYAFQIHGHLYVQVLEKGIYELKDKAFQLVTDFPLFKKDEIISLLEGPNKLVIIGTVHNGLYCLSENGKTVKPISKEINSILKTAQLNAATRLTDTTFAIGTIQRGVYILDNNGNILEHFDQQNGLQNNTILSLKKDTVGNLWVGMDRGIDQIVLQSPLRFFQDVNGDIGSVYAAAWFEGDFYIGSNDGLYRYDSNKGFVNVGGINWQVWSLDILGNQLFCAHNSGVAIIDKKAITNLPNMPGGWSIKLLRSNPNIALQGTYIGLALYVRGSDGLFHYRQNVKGLETMPISDWVEDANGNIWLKHAYKGLSSIKLSANYDSAIHWTILNSSNGILPDIQQNISYWANNVYTVSNRGISVWNHNGNRFETVNDLFGFSNRIPKIKKIFPTSNKCFWVVNDDNQLLYIDRNQNHFSFFLKDFFLVSGYENIITIDSSRSVLCGENGFALFMSNRINDIKSKPPYIDGVFVNKAGEFEPIATVSKINNSNWDVKYENRSVKIVVGNSIFDRLIKYRFKITKIGESSYWGEWQTETSKVYNELSSGTYQVEIQTNLSSQSTFFEFAILPPWYWSWWSKLFYVIIFLCAFAFLYHRMEKRHAKTLRQKQLDMEKQLVMQKMQHEHELLLLKKEKLEEEVQLKSEDLANSANELIKRKKLLNRLHNEIEKQAADKEKSSNISPSMKRLSKELERQLKLEKDESKLFEHGFNTVHEQFFAKLLNQYTNLTPQDLKLAAYLRMNLGTKEIAPLLNITIRGVELKRYRLRKKMNLDETVNLNEFMMKFI